MQTIEFVPEVLSKFNQYSQQRCWQKEAGGQLFAEFINKNLIRVVYATGPNKTDHRSKFYFYPDRLREQQEINTLYNKGLHYVGDWHTHPQNTPSPSLIDKESINECVRESKHDLNGFILVVVGRTTFPKGLFVGFSDGFKILPLKNKSADRNT